eukprot:m.74616 g.74616  ORF g.74616 m.74616 type:complete len:1195 (+) comp12471_c0_seq4:172-3756(+)
MGHMGGTFDDLAGLENLDETTLASQLESRYSVKQIYTWVGDILVAVNPYQDLGLYLPAVAAKYVQVVRTQVPPHVFVVADTAFSNAFRTMRSQVCVVSGESGAGKTETTKLIVSHILRLSTSTDNRIHDRILNMNPVLEAFGNAQTVMNNNSSRFGKYLELRMASNGNVIGARLSEYLLERSRVASHASGERTFHILYYICYMADERKEMLRLQSHDSYHYLNQGGADCDPTKMQNQWEEVLSALSILGISNNIQEDLMTAIAAVLHLGNIAFQENEMTEEASILDPGTANLAAQLLMVNGDDMLSALSSKTTVLRGETIVKKLNARQAADNRDGASKKIFGEIFLWLFAQLNKVLEPSQSVGESEVSIGLLDIFGFENFAKNSFEQLCINLANEQLQLYFNDHIFQLELDEFKREGLGTLNLTYNDNKHVLDMFLRKPIGLFTILDEESKLQSSTERSTLQKLGQHLAGEKTYEKTTDGFKITHYAGTVEYNIIGIIPKNRDMLPEDLLNLLESSKSQLIRDLFGVGRESESKGNRLMVMNPMMEKPRVSTRIRAVFSKRAGAGRMSKRKSRRGFDGASKGKKKIQTVSSQFAESLRLLVAKMTLCSPHFVRCIKPNKMASPSNYDADYTLSQLRYTGMLETVRIRREGYALRLTFAEFMRRYSIIKFPYSATPSPTGASVSEILKKAGLEKFLVGKTKVFLKYYHADNLNALMTDVAKKAVILQKNFRMFVCMRKYKRLLAVSRVEKEAVVVFMTGLHTLSTTISNMVATTDDEDSQRAARLPTITEETVPHNNALLAKSFKGRGISARIGTRAHAKLSKRQHKEAQSFIEREKRRGTIIARRSSLTEREPPLAPWFHGIMTRSEAEELLFGSSSGTYLIRVSESRCGYSLSTSQLGAFRHFQINVTQDLHYVLMGSTVQHIGLEELINYYKVHPMNARRTSEILVRPFGQQAPSEGDEKETEYAELFWPAQQAPAVPKKDSSNPVFMNTLARHMKNQNSGVMDNKTIVTMEQRFGEPQMGRRMVPIMEELPLPPPKPTIDLPENPPALNNPNFKDDATQPQAGFDYARVKDLNIGVGDSATKTGFDYARVSSLQTGPKLNRTPSEQKRFRELMNDARRRILEAHREYRKREETGNDKKKKHKTLKKKEKAEKKEKKNKKRNKHNPLPVYIQGRSHQRILGTVGAYDSMENR